MFRHRARSPHRCSAESEGFDLAEIQPRPLPHPTVLGITAEVVIAAISYKGKLQRGVSEEGTLRKDHMGPVTDSLTQ